MSKQTLSIIGVGAFGTLMARHLAPYFDLCLYDTAKDLTAHKATGITIATDLATVAASSIVVIAVPVQILPEVLQSLAPHIKPGTLVIDVSSVKSGPTQLMRRILPEHADIVGTHPLFGPQSGKNGIAGLNIAVCAVRGARSACVADFLREKLALNVFTLSPEEHDRQMAYVQGLTHLIAKVIVSLDLPPFQLTTKTFEHMQSMVEMVRYDSDDLFRAIERENPFAAEAKNAFFTAARKLEERMEEK